MVLGLMLSAWVFFEGFLVTVFSQSNHQLQGAAGLAVVAALLGALAAALAVPVPTASVVLFLLTGLISYGAASSGYGNHWLYGSLYLGLMALAFFGALAKRREKRERAIEKAAQAARDARMDALLTAQQQRSPGIVCHACGAVNAAGTRFCGNCGANLADNQPRTV
jgi:hypothetical protein